MAQRVVRNTTGTSTSRIMCFLVGFGLPFISFSREGVGAEEVVGFLDRIAPVDIIVLATALWLSVHGRLRTSITALAYLFVLALGSLAGILSGGGMLDVAIAFSSMVVPLSYFVVAYSVRTDLRDIRWLIAGIAAGGFLEAAIVAADMMFHIGFSAVGSESLARGTFRGKNQLGNYGYALAGVLLSIGHALVSKRSYRVLVSIAGVLGVVLIVAALRRGAIISIGMWAVLFVLLGFQHYQRKMYWMAGGVIMISMLCLWLFFGEALLSNAASSVLSGIRTRSEESFSSVQFNSVFAHTDRWFPFGLGLGRSMLVDPYGTYEIHNGHLSLLVELGIFGPVTFYMLIGIAVVTLYRNGRTFQEVIDRDWPIVRTATMTFLLSSMVFMYHGLAFRERGFMLFLGLVTGLGALTRNRGLPLPVYSETETEDPQAVVSSWARQ